MSFQIIILVLKNKLIWPKRSVFIKLLWTWHSCLNTIFFPQLFVMNSMLLGVCLTNWMLLAYLSRCVHKFKAPFVKWKIQNNCLAQNMSGNKSLLHDHSLQEDVQRILCIVASTFKKTTMQRFSLLVNISDIGIAIYYTLAYKQLNFLLFRVKIWIEGC